MESWYHAWMVGAFTGTVLGVALMALLQRLSHQRYLKHKLLAASIASISNMTLSDAKRLFPKGLFPAWILFGKLEKVGWINKELSMAWPFIQEAICPIVRATIESSLEQYRHPSFTALKCRQFSCGRIPPKVSGVQVLKSSSDEISIELELQWSGEQNMILGLQTSLGVPIAVQIRDATIAGTLRLTFKPLTDELPCFCAIICSLKELEKFDFVKSFHGNVPAIPGVLNMVAEMIHTAVTDSLIWPMHQVIKLLPGDYRNLEMHPVGVLQVKCVEAKNLLNKDIIGKSDPFALLYVRPIRKRMQKSKTVDNNLSPIWNETFKFEVEDLSTQFLFVKVLDEEAVQEPEVLGCAKFALKQLIAGNMLDVWLPLVKDFDMKYTTSIKYRGEIHLELSYSCTNEDMINSLGSSSLPRRSFRRQLTSVEKLFYSREHELASNMKKLMNPRSLRDAIIIRGVLSVMGLQADELVLRRPNKTLDSFVSLKTKKSKTIMKTKVVPKTFRPEWKESFHILVEDALHEMLIFEVWDHYIFHDRFLGRRVMTLTSLLQGSNGDEISSMKVNLEGVKSGTLFFQYKWTNPSPLDTQFL